MISSKSSLGVAYIALKQALKNKKLNLDQLVQYHNTSPSLITALVKEEPTALMNFILAKKDYALLKLLITEYKISVSYSLLKDVCNQVVLKNTLDWEALFILLGAAFIEEKFLRHILGYLLSLKTFEKEDEVKKLLHLFSLMEDKINLSIKFPQDDSLWGLTTNLLGYAIFHKQIPFIEFLLPRYNEELINKTLQDRCYRLPNNKKFLPYDPFSLGGGVKMQRIWAENTYNMTCWKFSKSNSHYISEVTFQHSLVPYPFKETIKKIGEDWIKRDAVIEEKKTWFVSLIELQDIGANLSKDLINLLRNNAKEVTKELSTNIEKIDRAMADINAQPQLILNTSLSNLLTPLENLVDGDNIQLEDNLKKSYLYKKYLEKMGELRNTIANTAEGKIEAFIKEPKKAEYLMVRLIKGFSTLFNEEQTKPFIFFEFLKVEALLAQERNFEALESYEKIMSHERDFTQDELKLMRTMQDKLINVFSLKIMENFQCFTYDKYRALQTLTSHLNGEIRSVVENFNNDISIILRIMLHFKHKTLLITDLLKDNDIDETRFQETLQKIRESDVRRQEEILQQFFIPIPGSSGRMISSLFYQILMPFIKNIISSLEEAKRNEEAQLAEEVKLNSPLRVAKMNLLIKELKEQTRRLLLPIYFPPLNREINEKEYEALRQQWITIPELTNEAKDNFHNLDEVNTQEMTLEDTSLQATANMYPSLSNDPSDLVTVSPPTYEESISYGTQLVVDSTDIPNPATVAQGLFSDNLLKQVTNLPVCEDRLENNQEKKADSTKPPLARQAQLV